jgi:hypothetical protein
MKNFIINPEYLQYISNNGYYSCSKKLPKYKGSFGNCRAYVGDFFAYLFNNSFEEEMQNFEFLFFSNVENYCEKVGKTLKPFEDALGISESEISECSINNEMNLNGIAFYCVRPNSYWLESPESLSLFTRLLRNPLGNEAFRDRGLIKPILENIEKFKYREKLSWESEKNREVEFYYCFHHRGIDFWYNNVFKKVA